MAYGSITPFTPCASSSNRRNDIPTSAPLLLIQTAVTNKTLRLELDYRQPSILSEGDATIEGPTAETGLALPYDPQVADDFTYLLSVIGEESREFSHDAGRDPTVRIWSAPQALEALGALSQRTRVGHGARRLQPVWQRLGILATRPRPFTRLPL